MLLSPLCLSQAPISSSSSANFTRSWFFSHIKSQHAHSFSPFRPHRIDGYSRKSFLIATKISSWNVFESLTDKFAYWRRGTISFLESSHASNSELLLNFSIDCRFEPSLAMMKSLRVTSKSWRQQLVHKTRMLSTTIKSWCDWKGNNDNKKCTGRNSPLINTCMNGFPWRIRGIIKAKEMMETRLRGEEKSFVIRSNDAIRH